jgi:hypothetical protein
VIRLKALRITRQWHPGEAKVPPDFQDMLDRIVLDASGVRARGGIGRTSVDQAPELVRIRDRRLRRSRRRADDRLPGHGSTAAGPERDDDLVSGAGLRDRSRRGQDGGLQRHRGRRGAAAGALAERASDVGTGAGLDQPLQLADAIRIAYCQPFVGAYFNFHLVDEPNLAGWQSGVYWADGSPKPAYQALRRTAAQVNLRSIDCAGFAPSGMLPRPEPVHEVGPPLQITDLKATSLASYGATITWQSSAPASTRVAYGVVGFGVPTA